MAGPPSPLEPDFCTVPAKVVTMPLASTLRMISFRNSEM